MSATKYEEQNEDDFVSRGHKWGAPQADLPRRNDGLSVRGSESPAERAARNVHDAITDFYFAILTAANVQEALRVHGLVNECLLALADADKEALGRADDLCGPARKEQ